MKILILDLMQNSDAPSELISPALADTLDRQITTASPLTVTLDSEHTINAVGVGNTDATAIIINGTTVTLSAASPPEFRNGLYDIASMQATTLTISHDGSYIGRLAMGTFRHLGCSPSREPGFWTTSEPRITLSGQVIPAAGGISGRQIGVEIKYKITREIFEDFQKAWPLISQGYPYFVAFSTAEQRRMPWERMYTFVNNDNGRPFIFQSSANKFLYSRKITLREAY